MITNIITTIAIAISIDIPIAIINIINIIIKKHHHENTKETNNFHQQGKPQESGP